MTQQEFQNQTSKYAEVIDNIKKSAHALHSHVNQFYGTKHPYGFHLDMVAEALPKYGHSICADGADILPMYFGAYFHDSIEDARQTYNDVMKTARQWMDESQALTATEIVYALTNEKGRTRAERAGEKYYQGIRETPYAPFLKLADRLANITYSFGQAGVDNAHMRRVYAKEWPHFIEAISVKSDDIRLTLPQAMVRDVEIIIGINEETL